MDKIFILSPLVFIFYDILHDKYDKTSSPFRITSKQILLNNSTNIIYAISQKKLVRFIYAPENMKNNSFIQDTVYKGKKTLMSILHKKRKSMRVFCEPKAGLEPATYSLRMSYSTN